MIMKSYLDMREAQRKRVDSAARLYLEELLSDYSRQRVMEKLRVQSYGTFRSNFDEGVNLRCIQLLKDGFNA